MDFEKEAREIAYGFWCGNCEGPSARPCKKHEGCYELIIEIKEALLRAHRQGQEEMRERASGAVPTSWLDSLLTGKGSPKIPYQGPDVEKLLDSLSNRIRNLPIFIDEQKSSPEFLPKASTKEVGIK